MKVLFDIGHPAHVHLFKNSIFELQNHGHGTLVLSRDKDVTTTLLDQYEIDHIPLSTAESGKLSLMFEWAGREFRTLKIVKSYDPDVVLSVASPPSSHAAWLFGSSKIIFNDTEITEFAAKITHPFADQICTPENFDRDIGQKQDRYEGYHELAYLHPNRFEPSKDVLQDQGIDPDDSYSILRFVSWDAHHDVGNQGLSYATKQELISSLSEYGDVYITSEDPISKEFEDFRLPIPPDKIHDLLYYADLYVGDSQTMATEAAVLGTPAIRSNSFVGDNDMSNFIELEDEYELLYSLSSESEVIKTAHKIMSDPNTQMIWEKKRGQLINDKIDVTDYMLENIYKWGRN